MLICFLYLLGFLITIIVLYILISILTDTENIFEKQTEINPTESICINLDVYSKYILNSPHFVVFKKIYNSFINFLKPKDTSFKIRIFLAKH